jgi:hypothetical protein
MATYITYTLLQNVDGLTHGVPQKISGMWDVTKSFAFDSSHVA